MRNSSDFGLVGKGSDSLYAPDVCLRWKSQSEKKDKVASPGSANPVS